MTSAPPPIKHGIAKLLGLVNNTNVEDMEATLTDEQAMNFVLNISDRLIPEEIFSPDALRAYAARIAELPQ